MSDINPANKASKDADTRPLELAQLVDYLAATISAEEAMQTYRPYATVRAFQVTDALFDDLHPNPLHVANERLQYDSEHRIVWILQHSGRITACEIGEWVVFFIGGAIMRCGNTEFRNTYEPQYQLTPIAPLMNDTVHTNVNHPQIGAR